MNTLDSVVIKLLCAERQESKLIEGLSVLGIDVNLENDFLDMALDLLGVRPNSDTYCRDWLTREWDDNNKTPEQFMAWVRNEMVDAPEIN